eukprot:symbB.v1.2.004298.t1/scaffold220.1/size262620/22
MHRFTLQEQEVNTAEDQDLLNRINLGHFQPVPVNNTPGLAEPSDSASRPLGELSTGTGVTGNPQNVTETNSDSAQHSEQSQIPSAEELRAQRLAHFGQPQRT